MIASLMEAWRCGDSEVRARDGLFRSLPVDRTLNAIRDEWTSLGITRSMDHTHMDRIGVPVFGFCIPSRVTESYCSGKGLTRDAALVSGLMEAYEYRCVTSTVIAESLLGKTIDEAAAVGALIDPASLPLPVEGEYVSSDRLDWMECLEIVEEQVLILPADLFAVGLPVRDGVRRGSGYISTNGKASGNTLLEAITHALLELIERDAYVLSNIDRERRVSRQSLERTPRLAELLEHIERVGIEVYLFDITSDLAVPCYEVYLSERSGLERYHIHAGRGCHVDAEVALLRAITEACQARVAYFVGARRDVADGDRAAANHNALVRAYRETNEVEFVGANTSWDDFRSLLDHLIRRLGLKGLTRILVTNLTPPRSRLACVSCWIPGLEGLYFRDGRLRLGARGKALINGRGKRRPGF